MIRVKVFLVLLQIDFPADYSTLLQYFIKLNLSLSSKAIFLQLLLIFFYLETLLKSKYCSSKYTKLYALSTFYISTS